MNKYFDIIKCRTHEYTCTIVILGWTYFLLHCRWIHITLFQEVSCSRACLQNFAFAFAGLSWNSSRLHSYLPDLFVQTEQHFVWDRREKNTLLHALAVLIRGHCNALQRMWAVRICIILALWIFVNISNKFCFFREWKRYSQFQWTINSTWQRLDIRMNFKTLYMCFLMYSFVYLETSFVTNDQFK